MCSEQIAMVSHIGAATTVGIGKFVDAGRRDDLVVHGLHDQDRRGGHRLAELDAVEDVPHLGCLQELLQRPVHQIVHILEGHGDDGPEGGHIFEPAEELLAPGGRVLFDHPFQTRVYMGESGDDKAGERGEQPAVETAEGMAEIAHGRPKDGTGDRKLGGIIGAGFGSPGRGESSAGVAPQADGRLPRESEPVAVEGRANSVESAISGLIRRAPDPVDALMIGNGDRPALSEQGGDQEQFELGEGAECPRTAPQRIRRKAAVGYGVDGALVRHDRHRRGRIVAVGYQDRGHRGFRTPIQVIAAVEQLGRGESLGNDAEKSHFDIAAAEHRSGCGVLVAEWG